MTGCGMMVGGGTGNIGWILLKVIYFVLGIFVASVIFWLTHNWIVKGKKRRR